jgi:hypothetical protein
MREKPTSGPWERNGDRVESEHEHGWVNGGWILAECMGPDAHGNARLMASAPDLLDALQTLLDYGLKMSAKHEAPIFEKARSAIAKATGT